MGLYEPGVPAYWAAVKAQRRAPAHYSAGNASALRQLQGPVWYYLHAGGAAPWRVWYCVCC
jgi:hypothetical protein